MATIDHSSVSRHCHNCLFKHFFTPCLRIQFCKNRVTRRPEVYLNVLTDNYEKPCKDLTEECLTNTLQLALLSFVKGSVNFGLETLDPYSIEKLEFNLPRNISVQFTKGVANGLKTCSIDFARLSENNLESQFHCNLTITGKYKATGYLYVFPIDGEGDSTIQCNNIKFYNLLKLRYKIEGNEQRYLEIIEAKMDHSYDGRVSYAFTNLIKGNTEMSNTAVDFINKNWRTVAEDLGGPLVDYGALLVMRNIKKLLEMVSLDQIVPATINKV